MGIYDRVMHQQEPPLAAHYFAAAINEFAFGRKTAAQIVTAFNLNAAETTELNALLVTIAGNLATKAQRVNEIHNVFMLGEGRIFYATAAELRAALGV